MSRIADLIAEHCPHGVPIRTLGECTRRNIGGGTPSRSRTDFWDGDIPWASVGDITACNLKLSSTRQFVTDVGLANSSSHIVPAGYVVVAVKIAPGAMRVVERDVAINQDLRGLLLRDEIDPYFLTYFFKTISIVGNGTIVKGITKSTLERVRIPVPPLDVQREIVSILDTFTALEAELEAELEARRHQYEHYRRKVLAPADGNSRVLVRDVADFFNARAHEKLVSPDGTIALMTARFVSRGEANRFVRPEDVLTPAIKGDVAMVMSDLPNGRALARTFYVDQDDKYAANQRVCLLRSRDTTLLLPRYLYYALNRNEQLLAYDSGVDQTHLKKDYILDVALKLPSATEQQRIVDTLDTFDALVNDLSIGLPAELAARRRQYEFYRDKLLTFEEALS